MEYCDVGDLSSFIRERYIRLNPSARNTGPCEPKFCINENEASYIIRDIVRGLAHLQFVCKIMHRDIKLDNILVKLKNRRSSKLRSGRDKFSLPIDDYEFKLGDLGLAKTFKRDS